MPNCISFIYTCICIRVCLYVLMCCLYIYIYIHLYMHILEVALQPPPPILRGATIGEWRVIIVNSFVGLGGMGGGEVLNLLPASGEQCVF
jgi:hypothetical protein